MSEFGESAMVERKCLSVDLTGQVLRKHELNSPRDFVLLKKTVHARSCTGTAVLHRHGIKCFFKECRDIDSTTREASMLVFAKSIVKDCDAVEIAGMRGLFREGRLVFMDRLPVIDNMFNYIFNYRYLVHRCLHNRLMLSARGIGGWLRRFHVECPGDVVAEYARIEKAVGGRLRAIEASRPGLIDDCVRERIQEVVAGARRQCPAAFTGVSRTHGDLNLSNLLVLRNGCVSIVDFADSRIGLGLEDVGNVYHNLSLLGAVRPGVRGTIRRLLSAFSEGYGLRGEESALNMCRIQAALVYVLSVAASDNAGGVRRKMLKANLKWLSEC